LIVKRRITRRELLSQAAVSTASAALASLIPGCGEHIIPSQPTYQADIVIMGATPSGIMAARAAMREGATVAIIDNTTHVGGILTSGLMTDLIFPQGLGGLPAQFYRDVGKYYGLTNGQPQYVFEPHAAEAIFNGYLNSPQCTVILGKTLRATAKTGTVIQRVVLSDGSIVQGNQWVDASYEGDLLAQSGAEYAVGRESRSLYGEDHAGWGIQQWRSLPPYLANGSLLPGLNADPGEMAEAADNKIMAYTFRCCITSNPANMAPFPQPPGYSSDQFAFTSELISIDKEIRLPDILLFQTGVNDKYCLLYNGWGSSDYVGASWNYPDGDWTTRAAVYQAHYNYVAGLLYFLSNDPSVPASLRNSVQGYGLPLDEFTDNAHWPWQMYIREGRRLVGQYVMTEADVTSNPTKADSIGVSAWALDCHGCDAIAVQQNGVWGIAEDGYFYDTDTADGYELPLRALLPTPAQVSNLVVSVCVSSSHVGFSSIRIEPAFMILGEAAGTASGMAVSSGQNVSAVDPMALRNKLLSYGAIVNLA
jgi:hypothetical protein